MNLLASAFKGTLSFVDNAGNICDPKRTRHPQQAASILNAVPDTTLRDSQELTLIWINTQITFDSEDTQRIKQQLHTLNAYVLFYSDIDQLTFYLQTCTKEKIIIITTIRLLSLTLIIPNLMILNKCLGPSMNTSAKCSRINVPVVS
jgi:nitrate/nitrite-specific signal transduction histidine kinase